MHDDVGPVPDDDGQTELEAAADGAAISAILAARGRDAEALRTLEQSTALLERVLGEDHLEVGAAYDQLATMLLRAGRNQEAAPLYERALVIFERTLGHRHPRTVICRTNRNKALRKPTRDGRGLR